MLPNKIDFDWRKQYQCPNCEKIFDMRHKGTVIMRMMNVRLIGMLDECIEVEVMADSNSKLVHQKLSTRFCCSDCMIEYFNKLKKKIDKMLSKPPIENIMNFETLGMEYVKKRQKKYSKGKRK